MWVLIVHALPCHSTYALHQYNTQGILASEIIASIVSMLNFIIIWNTNNVQLTKEEIASMTEQMNQENVISMVIQSLQEYIMYTSYKCVSHVLNMFSELVLTSNKFLLQVNSPLL